MRTLPIHRKEAAHVNKIMHRPIGVTQNLARLASSQNSSSPFSTSLYPFQTDYFCTILRVESSHNLFI
jgi:hypothetical protein